MSAVTYSVPKLGRSPYENEDSAGMAPATGRFAVADGASTSARPEVWSRLLVTSFVEEGLDPLAPEVLVALRRKWSALVDSPSLPWYAQAKLQRGADSTFLGLQVDSASRTFRAHGVGDSCLFHLRGAEVLLVGPVTSPDDFSRFPELVSSLAGAEAPPVTTLSGGYQAGDVFLLATDAIARYLLVTYERHGRTAAWHRTPDGYAQFVRRVASYRRRGQLANDDTTLCVVRT
ncbi:hypothetical protein GSF22_26430 [Micromonospora echinofusca]|uniref:Protein phosphatase 2C n=2 Tax=Micromonospora echinofusca TaxID=47858 RepID=A0ABS3VY82_MICEH|nr:hypothetical protein [Micromonospora echinofusca]